MLLKEPVSHTKVQQMAHTCLYEEVDSPRRAVVEVGLTDVEGWCHHSQCHGGADSEGIDEAVAVCLTCDALAVAVDEALGVLVSHRTYCYILRTYVIC